VNTLLPRCCGLFALLACAGEPPAATPPPLDALPALPGAAASSEGPRGEARPTRYLSLALVGEVRGEIEPCGCPTLPYGGFARRGALLDRLREEEPLLHIDAGELLLKGASPARAADRARRGEALLSLSEAVGLDLWVPGPTDLLALGPDGLRAPLGFPTISATWTLEGAPLLSPTAILEAGGLRVGVIGLSGELRGEDRVATLDPVLAARAALAGLPADLDLVLAIGSVDDALADRVAREVEGLPLVLSTKGSAYEALRQPERPDGSLGAVVIEAPDRGRYVQRVELRIAGPAAGPIRPPADPLRWQERRDLVGRLRRSPDDAALQARGAALEAALDEEGRGRILVATSTIPLSADLDPPGGPVRAQVDRFHADTQAAAVARAAAPPPPTVPTYATASACVSCHTKQMSRWALTDHARAWESLLARQSTQNPECVGCHSTGFGEPGGFGDPAAASALRFKAVQCEACHGPMAGHPDDGKKPPAVTIDTCTGCHDAANSPEFAFGRYLQRATCQSR